MFLLMRYCLKKLVNRKKDRNICILGLDSAGKSSMLNHLRYQFNEPNYVPSSDEMVPTIGLNFSKLTYKSYNWTIWDLGGQMRFRYFTSNRIALTPSREIWESYFQDIDLLIWVVDSADRERFEESYEALKKLLEDPQTIYIPLAVIANKQDVEGAADQTEITNALKLKELVDRKWEVFRTSFKGDFANHFGLDEVLNWVVNVLSEPISKQRTEWRKSQIMQTDK